MFINVFDVSVLLVLLQAWRSSFPAKCIDSNRLLKTEARSFLSVGFCYYKEKNVSGKMGKAVAVVNNSCNQPLHSFDASHFN